MVGTIWDRRWDEWTDERLSEAVTPRDQSRFEGYAKTILRYLTPQVTLDIGGGTGILGRFLPGDYIVMDHPRMEQFCQEGRFVAIGPLEEVSPKPDLVVNTNSWGETSDEVIASYLDQIATLRVPFLYLNNRKFRQVDFDAYPLERWKTIVYRDGGKPDSFVEFLGELQ